MTGARMRLLLISGSVRTASSNAVALRRAADLGRGWFESSFYAGLPLLPAFNPDVEELGESDAQFPEAALDLRRAVGDADALLVSTPEYAHGLPGALKNALDWLVGSVTFPGISVGLLNVSPRSVHAPAQFLETVRTMSAVVVSEACVTRGFGGTGSTATDAEHAEAWEASLRQVMAALAASARASRRRG